MYAHHNAYSRRVQQRRGFGPSAKTIWVLVCLTCGMAAGTSMVAVPTVGNAVLRLVDPSAVDKQYTSTTLHTVAPGETLYGIAQAVDPNTDPRPIVDEILDLNSMQSADIYPGEVLIVPKGGK